MANNKAELSKKDLKKITAFLEANIDEICDTWKDYFRLDKISFYKD